MKLEQVILRNTRASQPAATAVPTGTIYYVTDENLTERSNGTTWDDISDVNPLSGGSATEYAEDTPHTTGDFGVMALVVRKDAAASIAGTDGDYTALQVDATGNLRVTGGGGGTQYAEDVAHTTGDLGTMALVVRKDSATALAGADGDYAPLQVDATGALRVTSTGGSSGTQYAEDAVHASGDLGMLSLVVRKDTAASIAGTDGDYTALQVNSTGALRVTGGGSTQYAEDAVHASGDLGTMALAVRKDSATALAADGDYVPLQVDSTGALRVTSTGGGGSGTQYAEDVAHVTGDLGTMALAVRKDSAAAIATTDGDYTPLQVDATGNLRITGAVTIASGSVTIVGGGPTQYAEDAVHASGDLGFQALAVRKDTAAAIATTDGDYTPLQTNNVGALRVTGGGSVQFAEDAAHTSGDLGTMALAVRKDAAAAIATTDGDYTPLQVDATGALRVTSTGGSGGTQWAEDAAHTSGDVGTLLLAVRKDFIPAASTNADGDYTTLTTDSYGQLRVVGLGMADTDDAFVSVNQTAALVIPLGYEHDGTNHIRVRGPNTVAHDAADAGNPIKIGAQAITAPQPLVATGDRTTLYAGIDGALITRPFTNPENIWMANVSNTDGTSTQLIMAQGGSYKTMITSLVITNTHASTDTYVEIKDGTTVRMTVPAPHASGAVVPLPLPLVGSLNTAWNFDPAAAVTTIIVSGVGYVARV